MGDKPPNDSDEDLNRNIFRIMREVDEQDYINQYESSSNSDDDDSETDSDDDRGHQSRLLYYLTPVRSAYPINGLVQAIRSFSLSNEPHSLSETDEDEENRAQHNRTNNENTTNDVEEQATHSQSTSGTNNDADPQNEQNQSINKENEEKDNESDQAQQDQNQIMSGIQEEDDQAQLNLNRGTNETDEQSVVIINEPSDSSDDEDNASAVTEELEKLFLQAKSYQEFKMLKKAFLLNKKSKEMRKIGGRVNSDDPEKEEKEALSTEKEIPNPPEKEPEE